MTSIDFEHIVVPIASEEDAAATAAALAPRLTETVEHVVPVYVVEKAGGAPDKASVEQRELAGNAMLSTFAEGLDGAATSIDPQIHYGTDVAETIRGVARDVDADAIVFHPRGGSRWTKLVTGDVAHGLLRDPDVPLLVLPEEAPTDG